MHQSTIDLQQLKLVEALNSERFGRSLTPKIIAFSYNESGG
jgi:hypothetical protein